MDSLESGKMIGGVKQIESKGHVRFVPDPKSSPKTGHALFYTVLYVFDIDRILQYDRRIDMPVVTVSPKFQVVIPREVRDELGIEVGQKIQVIAIDNRVEMIPVRSARSMRGFLKGLNTNLGRDRDRV